MRNLKVGMSYYGFNYHGFQSQPNTHTVQGEIEEQMQKLIGNKVEINGCSRTDAGVSAINYYFNFLTESTITCSGFILAMNSLLPKDIAIKTCEECGMDFHARFSTVSKEYLYIIDNSPIRNVFTEHLALFYPYHLNVEHMLAIAQNMVGTHDFSAFCKAESLEHLSSTVRTVTEIRIIKEENLVKIYVSGTGFLHNMVRIIVGTLIAANEGKRSKEDLLEALATGNRAKCGKTVPAWGLYLSKVNY